MAAPPTPVHMLPSSPEGSRPRPHRFDLFEAGKAIGRLEWRAVPRPDVGWYLTRPSGESLRLAVDTTIDELAADAHAATDGWLLNAELAAILTTALALDAAERALHPGSPPRRRRFRRSEVMLP